MANIEIGVITYPTYKVNSNRQSSTPEQVCKFFLRSRTVRLRWSQARLKELIDILQLVLGRFENFCRHLIKFDLIFSPLNHEKKDEFCDLDARDKEIYIYLDQGPEKVLGNAPYLLADKLAELYLKFFTTGYFALPKINFDFLKDDAIIDEQLLGIYNHYARERGCELNQAGLRELFTNLLEYYVVEILKWKLSCFLLHPHLDPHKEIAIEIERVTADFQYIFNPLIADPDKVPLWSMIGYLAMLAILAKKYGYHKGYLKCQDVLSEKNEESMTAIELHRLPQRDLEYFRKYPLDMERQFKRGPAGHHVILNAFQYILENIFDGFSLSYG